MIYLVEDDDNIRELVEYTLCMTGMETKGFGLPGQFWAAMEAELPQLILLDIMLPEEDGLHILERLKAQEKTEAIPVIMLSAKGSEMDKVRGLEMGADDYIAKPFGMMELVARVKARLRLSGGAGNEPVRECYRLGALLVEPAQYRVEVGGEPVLLTRKEFELLLLLLRNRKLVMTRERILEKVWGYLYDGESRTVDVHIRSLRKKLGRAGDVIETVRGIGYQIK